MTYSLHAFKNWTTNFLDFYNHSHSFPNSIERCLDFPSGVGRWKILLGGTFYAVVEIRGGRMLNIDKN